MSGCVRRWARRTGLVSLRANLQSRVSSAMARSAASAAIARGVRAAGSSADSVSGSVAGAWQSLYSSLTSETATFLTCPRNSEASFLHCKGHQVGSAWSESTYHLTVLIVVLEWG
jgi:hypothetical protein